MTQQILFEGTGTIGLLAASWPVLLSEIKR